MIYFLKKQKTKNKTICAFGFPYDQQAYQKPDLCMFGNELSGIGKILT